MLSISKPIKANQGDYYLSLATTDDYYLSGTEPPGYWLGQGAAALQVGGQVQPETFRNLLRGFSHDGQTKLVRNTDSERRAGWDLTWSPPKSVSVGWSQASPDIRQQIEACMNRAVAAGIDYLQSVGPICRRGEDGHIHETAKITFASFLHSTSRSQDPQLHVHTVLLNIGVRPDGTTGTLEPKTLFRHQMAAGALFRTELAKELEINLGLRARREGRAFELLGVDPELISFFSKRRAQIEAELNRSGFTGAKAAEMANFVTREKKISRPRAELFSEWQQAGLQHHWSTKELSWLLHAPFPSRHPEQEIRSASKQSLSSLTTSLSFFTERDLTRAVAEECQGRGLGAADALSITRELLQSKELVKLAHRRGEIVWTTQEILDLEQSILATAQGMQQNKDLLIHHPFLTAEVIERNPHLSQEQQAALLHLDQGTGSLCLIHGMAGTGKSTLFAAAREMWETQGFTVYGAALSGKAASGLQEATQIPCKTLHRTLCELDDGTLVLTKNTVLVIDEASMVGTRQWAKLFPQCHDAGATLVLCGDPKQLQAIELGGIFSELIRRFGASELVDIRRQKEEWAREAVKDFAWGYAETALQAYQERGLLHEASDSPSAIEKLVLDWQQESLIHPEKSIILASTHADVRAINELAQKARREAGLVHGIAAPLEHGFVFAGDRVLFTRNSMTLSVCNGDLGIVKEVFASNLTVKLDSGKDVTLDLQNYPHLALGYAMTTHKAQGLTVQTAFILTGGAMTDREMAYVQASRAQNATHWYVGHDLDELAQQMERSHAKETATSLREDPEISLLLNR